MKIVIHPSYQQYESGIKKILSQFDTMGEIIYEGRNLIKKFNCEDVDFIIKRFRKPHFINRIAYATVRGSKAARSYENGLELIRQGFFTAIPIAYIENYNWGLTDSYYISTFLDEAHEMREFWFQPEIGNRRPVLEAFGAFTADLHKKNIYHKDYSSGNVLYKNENGNIRFYLVDINRMRFNKKISQKEAYRNFERLWLPDETYRIIASSYARGMKWDETKTVKKIIYYKNKFMNSK